MEIRQSAADNSNTSWTLNTARLSIRRAESCQEDVDLLLKLWSNSAVMANVGFPLGLKIKPEEIAEQLTGQGSGEFDCVLVVTSRPGLALIGECKLGYPNAAGIAHTDIKLLPEYWGKGYGKEIKLVLLDYLFTHTTCQEVRATPNRSNVASIRLQESVGGRRIGEGIYRFPESMRADSIEVPYIEYAVFREDWMKSR